MRHGCRNVPECIPCQSVKFVDLKAGMSKYREVQRLHKFHVFERSQAGMWKLD